MLKYLALSLLAINALTGCSSTQPVSATSEPYCYTEETVTRNNDSVSSSTKLECSDNPIKRAKLVGVDEANCRQWERSDVINGRTKTYGGYICRDAKGVWRPLSDF